MKGISFILLLLLATVSADLSHQDRSVRTRNGKGNGQSNSFDIPDDLFGGFSMSVKQAYVTNQRYTNDDVIWGRPKGISFLFPGYRGEQVANLYPDGASTYFTSLFTVQAGWRLTFKAEFPHARYMSYTIANSIGGGQFGGGTSINAKDIVPDAGSFNPFTANVSRSVTNRNYTIYVVQSPPPPTPAPNTLYINNNNVNKTVKFVLRTYLVDQFPKPGYDGTGVVMLDDDTRLGMPVATLTLPNGTNITGPSLLSLLQVIKVIQPVYPISNWEASIAVSNDTVNAPASPVIMAERFYNIPYNIPGSFFMHNPLFRVQNFPPTNAGGFSNNPETMYLSFGYSFSFGEVVVVRGKMPTFPKTQKGDEYFDPNTQVQYFSVSICGSAPCGKCWNTVHDEDIPLDEDGYYTVVVSWVYNRPSNARLSNGVVWMDAGLGEGDYVRARGWIGGVVIRFQNPNPSWVQSPANIPIPSLTNPQPQDAVVMGEYYPIGTYMSKAYFEANY